jgi:hypothetical protein
MRIITHPDRLWIGVVVGIMLPVVSLALLMSLYGLLEQLGWAESIGLRNQFRIRTLAVLAIATNLIPFTMYNRRYFIHSMRGMIFPTLVYVAIWFFYFRGELF